MSKAMGKAIGISPGVAIAKAFVLNRTEWELHDAWIEQTLIQEEMERLQSSIDRAKQELEQLKNHSSQWLQEDQQAIFDAHMAILCDPIWIAEMNALIEKQAKSAAWAVKETSDHYIQQFNAMDDEYMRERATDVRDIADRLMRVLHGQQEDELPDFDEPVILVIDELTPSQMAQIDPTKVLGIVAATGGQNSHSAIMSRAMELPFVVFRQSKLIRRIRTGDLLIVDGGQGNVFRNPGADLLKRMQEQQTAAQRQRELLRAWVNVQAQTRDGEQWALYSNISSLKELDLAVRNGAQGVGLFRTEFLFMDRETLPTEEEQFEIYRQAAMTLKGKPLVIRTIDIGGDKVVPSLMLPREQNPFLGYRAIRIALDRPELFRTQLRAILRASAYGNVRCLLPMICGLDELRQTKAMIEEIKQDLRYQGMSCDAKMPLGIMIELPSVIWLADDLAAEADFFSIGTNDLTQYMLAVDRMNEKIAHLFNPLHPAVVRAIAQVVEAANRANIPVSVCGELAGDPLALPLWLGLGIKQLSMTASAILPLKQRLCANESRIAKEQIPTLLRAKTAEEIRYLLQQFQNLYSISP